MCRRAWRAQRATRHGDVHRAESARRAASTAHDQLMVQARTGRRHLQARHAGQHGPRRIPATQSVNMRCRRRAHSAAGWPAIGDNACREHEAAGRYPRFAAAEAAACDPTEGDWGTASAFRSRLAVNTRPPVCSPRPIVCAQKGGRDAPKGRKTAARGTPRSASPSGLSASRSRWRFRALASTWIPVLHLPDSDYLF